MSPVWYVTPSSSASSMLNDPPNAEFRIRNLPNCAFIRLPLSLRFRTDKSCLSKALTRSLSKRARRGLTLKASRVVRGDGGQGEVVPLLHCECLIGFKLPTSKFGHRFSIGGPKHAHYFKRRTLSPGTFGRATG